MDKFEKRAPNRYYDDILNVEYRVRSEDRFSGTRFDTIEEQKSAQHEGVEASRRNR
jgi:hypothetical protein